MEPQSSGVGAAQPAGQQQGGPPVDWAALAAVTELRELVAERRRYRWALNAAWIAAFAAYLLLMTTGQSALGSSVFGTVNLSFLMVVLLQVLTFVLVAVYARKSNRDFEPMEIRARQRFQQTARKTEESQP